MHSLSLYCPLLLQCAYQSSTLVSEGIIKYEVQQRFRRRAERRRFPPPAYLMVRRSIALS